MALVALLTGVYHLSRRKAAELLGDMAGVRISVGTVSTVEARVSAAVQPSVCSAAQSVFRYSSRARLSSGGSEVP